MGKSSSSSKKIKRSKDSSKLRSVKKKKTTRNKSKKIRRIKDYSDESQSSGSDSSLYSSSDSDYRREKRRSKVSKKKKKLRKRYSSSESDDDDDDDIRHYKKKKRSKSKDEHVGTKKKKKIVSRKRRRRDSSSSSTSSDSCSNRDNQSDDGIESDGKRRTRDRERLGKVKAARRKSKDESEEDSEPDECWQVEDEVRTEKNPRRLKSIVVVSYNYGNDERKEDMADDHVDESYEDKVVDDYGDGESTFSYPRTGADDNGRKTVGYDEYEEYNDSETSEPSHPDNSSKDDDLEAILKKRALENLKRFRGETQRNGIAIKEVSYVAEREPLQIESEKTEESQDHGDLMKQKLCVSAGSRDFETSEKILQVVNVKESRAALANLASQQDQQSGDTAKVKASSGISSCKTKRKLIRPVLGQESSNLASRKEATGCQDAEAESISGSNLDKNCPEISLALATKNGGENIEPTKVQTSSHADTETLDTETLDEIKGGSQSEQKKIDETKDESQYEQKTMTVMKNGEMVQVSYKVYIPKKTSSLGRRQFRR